MEFQRPPAVKAEAGLLFISKSAVGRFGDKINTQQGGPNDTITNY
jgi:hypothetical protein